MPGRLADPRSTPLSSLQPITDRHGRRHRGISVDIDGTLYAVGPTLGWRAFWIKGALHTLTTIRDARDTLRGEVYGGEDALRDALCEAVMVKASLGVEEARALLARPGGGLWARLLPGLAAKTVGPALLRLREAGVRLAAFSDDLPEVKLEALGLGEVFEVVVSAERQGAYKPQAPGFEAVQEALGLPAEALLHVGDRVETDVLGAHGVGWDAALVGGERAEPPTWVVRDIAELVERVLAAPDGRPSVESPPS